MVVYASWHNRKGPEEKTVVIEGVVFADFASFYSHSAARGQPEYTIDPAVPDQRPAPLISKFNWTAIFVTNSAWSSSS